MHHQMLIPREPADQAIWKKFRSIQYGTTQHQATKHEKHITQHFFVRTPKTTTRPCKTCTAPLSHGRRQGRLGRLGAADTLETSIHTGQLPEPFLPRLTTWRLKDVHGVERSPVINGDIFISRGEWEGRGDKGTAACQLHLVPLESPKSFPVYSG